MHFAYLETISHKFSPSYVAYPFSLGFLGRNVIPRPRRSVSFSQEVEEHDETSPAFIKMKRSLTGSLQQSWKQKMYFQ